MENSGGMTRNRATIHALNNFFDHMKSIIQFTISREEGVYTAEGVNAPIATEARTFEELQDNIRDAVALYFEGDDPASLGFDKAPAILTNFEVSPLMHAGRA
jgi:hypothetical protein